MNYNTSKNNHFAINLGPRYVYLTNSHSSFTNRNTYA